MPKAPKHGLKNWEEYNNKNNDLGLPCFISAFLNGPFDIFCHIVNSRAQNESTCPWH